MTFIIFLIIIFIIIFVMAYRKNAGNRVYKYIVKQTGFIYDKYAPYSFKAIRQKVKELGQEYTPKQYAIQVTIFMVASAAITYLYFYNLLISIIYSALSVIAIPYFIRCEDYD